ncbi:unannotated protein [freshwater metagenome]|uniref:Unannotated protein n=1 Tax=freshwater metagenome TaxID=449393 RepID=A0A6J6BU12_9ZZZZ
MKFLFVDLHLEPVHSVGHGAETGSQVGLACTEVGEFTRTGSPGAFRLGEPDLRLGDARIQRGKDRWDFARDSLGVFELDPALDSLGGALCRGRAVGLESARHLVRSIALRANAFADRFHIDANLQFDRSGRLESNDSVVARRCVERRARCGDESLECANGVTEVGVGLVDGARCLVECRTDALDFRASGLSLGPKPRLLGDDFGIPRIGRAQVGQRRRGNRFG